MTMSTDRKSRVRLAIVFTLSAVVLAGCSREEKPAVHAATTVSGGKIVVAGARPAFPADLMPVTGGFLESVSWDESAQTLHLKGWAPLDVRPPAARFVLRDPFNRLLLSGDPVVTSQERPDVAQAHPQDPALRHAGFTASLQVVNLPNAKTWPDALELYCLAEPDRLLRLAPLAAPGRVSWDRRPDRFEIVLTYTTPPGGETAGHQGNVDACAPGPEGGTVRLVGWALFDGRAPTSVLVVQLPPTAAPAALVSAAWVQRPDVRTAVDAGRAELDRSGFDVVLRVALAAEALRPMDGLRLWSLEAGGNLTALGLDSIRPGR
jgi:hypothetical protein